MNELKPPVIREETARAVEVEVLPKENPGSGPTIGHRPLPAAGGSVKLALTVAVLADAIQIGLFPIFGPGFASPANIVLDVAAFLFFWRVLGWHPALLPGFIFEQLPLLDLAPTWTIAVWIATRNRQPKSVHTAEERPFGTEAG